MTLPIPLGEAGPARELRGGRLAVYTAPDISMSGTSHAYRMRQALLRSAKEAGDAVHRAFRSEEAVKLSPLGVSTTDVPLDKDDGGKTTASVCPSAAGASLPISMAAVVTSFSKGKDGGPILHDAPFIRAGFASGNFPALDGSLGCPEGIGATGSRLEESEDWYITDMIAGRHEEDVFLASEEGSRQGSMVVVSSVDSLASMDNEEEERPPSCRDGSARDESEERLIPSLALENPNTRRSSSFSSIVDDVGQQISIYKQSLFPELKGVASICMPTEARESQRERFYMINAGNGWKSYRSLQVCPTTMRHSIQLWNLCVLMS